MGEFGGNCQRLVGTHAKADIDLIQKLLRLLDRLHLKVQGGYVGQTAAPKFAAAVVVLKAIGGQHGDGGVTGCDLPDHGRLPATFALPIKEAFISASHIVKASFVNEHTDPLQAERTVGMDQVVWSPN